MADLNNEPLDTQDLGVDNEGEPQSTTVVEPVVAQTQAQPSPDTLAILQRMDNAEAQSRALLQQMMAADRNRPAAAAAPEPVVPADILAGATPIVRAVIGKELQEIGNLRNVLGNLIAENQGTRERSFILGQVPEFETMKGEIAQHIHSQLDQLGVSPDAESRRQYFTPISVVTAANFLKAQKGVQPTASEALNTRSVVEGRGGGTAPGAAVPPVDFSTMSDSDFAKYEAKISALRMARNHG